MEMTWGRFVVILLFLLMTLGTGVGAVQEDIPDSRTGAVERYLDQRAREFAFSGAVLVMRDGQVLLKRAYGQASRELGVANTVRTRMRIASLTKPFTAMAIVKLAQQNRLEYDDRVCVYLPQCPEAWTEITLRHLLQHTSGIPGLFGEMKAVPVEDTAAEFERVLAAHGMNSSLASAPGESYAYSNYGYAVLGYVIEKASGETFPDALQKLVLGPLNLTDTVYDDPRPLIGQRAAGYNIKGGRVVNTSRKDPAGYAAGGLLSTIDDLSKWLAAVFYSDFVSPEQKQDLFEAPQGYGFGWALRQRLGRSQFNHTGSTFGFSSFFGHYPDEAISVAVLSNVEETQVRAMACDISAMVFGHDRVPFTGSVQASRDQLSELVGDYRSEDDTTYSISLEDDGLHIRWRSNDLKMVPVSSTQYAWPDFEEVRVHAVRSAEGALDTIVLSQCGDRSVTAIR
ncbi:MAG: serine hydrolase domain-containing protein [Xanthomonadales bacterium]|nr:serine hydrolase domain-containing protein [Xanthomonadales bacterium]